MKNYDHQKIEQKWQEQWQKDALYTVPDTAPGKENFYLLVEFPYPSGNLHVGHWYAFAVPDILARALRMQGKNVMYPIGFDAFGLPAENAAIKNNLNPRDWTLANIAHMKEQIGSMGTSFDWSRLVVTCEPEYYQWTQWLFLQFFNKGLAYRKETAVNWCPKDKTVLANEQVIAGKCDRCGTEVEQRQMLQWNIKITDYADRLIDDLEPLDWPEQIKESQRNWIGRSEGAQIDFAIEGSDEKVTVFTTRADTIFGATYLVLAPEHPLVQQLKPQITNAADVEAYVAATQKKSDMDRQASKEKTGVELKGVMATNPATKEPIPVFIADYVLGHYGTGAIMAVPAHDERDYDFANKFGIPIKQVIAPHLIDKSNPPQSGKKTAPVRETIHAIVHDPKTDSYLALKWKQFPWTTFVVGGVEPGENLIEAAKREVLEETGYKNLKHVRTFATQVFAEYFAAHKDENRIACTTGILFELVDDEKISIAAEESEKFESIWLSRNELTSARMTCAELPIWLDSMDGTDFYSGDGDLINSASFDGLKSDVAKKAIVESVGGKLTNTYRLRDWIVSRQRYWGVPIPIIHCPQCGAVPVPESELPLILPEVEDYLPTGDGKSPLAKVRDWAEVICPNCGGDAERETDTFDTFVDSSWYFLRYTDPKNAAAFASPEKLADWMPVDLYSGGAEHTTMHVLYSRFWQKALYDLGLVKDAEPYTRRMNRSLIMGPDGQKMSKSKGNVIDPDEVVKLLGADTVRLYLAFIGPYNEVASYPWNPDGVVGVRRFLERIAKIADMVQDADVAALNNPLHKTIKKVGEDIVALKFNTAISQMMILVNAIEKEKVVGRVQYEMLLKLIAPFAPHMAEELWHEIGNTNSVHLESWPGYDASLMKDDTVTIAIQVNGKTRGDMQSATDADKDSLETAAREVAAKYLEGKSVARVVIVPNRLVNFVVSE